MVLSGQSDALKAMRINAILREPIVHFLFVGALLFGASSLYARATDPKRIVVTDADVDRLAQRYSQQFGAPPALDRLTHLIDLHIRDEALFRKGLAMGLGEGDEVVRRRIIQKMEFLAEGDGDVEEPSLAQLQMFYKANAERYRKSARVSFTHLYFSPDIGDAAAARSRAAVALAQLQESANPSTISSDRFPDRRNYARLGLQEAEQVFGKSELAQALYTLPVGVWAGPVRSGYGWHLVRIDLREELRPPLLTEIEEELRADWQDEQRARLKDERLTQLLREYEVVRDDIVAKSSGG